MAYVLCILGMADIPGCGHRLHSRVRESVPRQVDKKSGGPQGERGLEFSRRKGQTFLSTFLSLSQLHNSV